MLNTAPARTLPRYILQRRVVPNSAPVRFSQLRNMATDLRFSTIELHAEH